jgi:AFG3 family protein
MRIKNAAQPLQSSIFIAAAGITVVFFKNIAGALSGGGPSSLFKMGKNTAKKVNKELVTTTFADVAGCDEAKKEIMEFVEFLKDSKKFTDLGAKIPKGALLCGPPGTGKTLLAKAMAGESNVPFFSISGSDFVEMYVGMGAARVRDLFKEARLNAPSIVFIDEIDAIGRQRGGGGMGGSNDERESTLNQLLVEMDGFDPSTNVVVLAGTNRADVLDTALLRPGRFDRQIQVDRPDIAGRKSIFDVYLKNITLNGEPSSYSARLAALTPGFTGADIANICNEAAILAARRMKTMVDMKDFETATERIIGGLESHKLMSPEIRKVIAYHEAGHAIAGWNLEHADPLLKVTIVPRGGGALGFAQYLPQEIFLRSKDQILDRVCVALAGRASEQVNFGKVTTGASDDLKRVTEIVYQMVQVYGMNDKIGQVSFPKEQSSFGPADRLYSNATAEKMDFEVKLIVDEAYKRTIKLMEDKKEQVILVAELLLAKETITNGDVVALIGKRPFQQSVEYEKYASSGWGVEAKEEDLGGVSVAMKDIKD